MYETKNEAETAAFGETLGAFLRAGDSVLLRGDLGAGKSVLARGVMRALGVRGAMPSPTFTLMQPYRGRENIYHFDLYRLEDEDEFFEAGLCDYLGGDGIALVEWPIPDMEIPSPALVVDMSYTDAGRGLRVEARGFGAREAEISAALRRWRRETDQGISG